MAVVAATLAALLAGPVARAQETFRAWELDQEFVAPDLDPTSPHFSADGELLFVGNRSAQALLLVRLPNELFQVPLDLVPALVEPTPEGDYVLLAEEQRAGGVRLGRLAIGSWESSWRVLETPGPLVDLALSPRGDRCYLAERNSSGLWYVDLQELMGMGDEGSAVERVGRIFLPSGPAAEIEILGNGDRLLAVSQEAGPGTLPTQARKGRLAAELTLLNPYRGSVVDWYWSQSGRGTASMAVPGLHFGEGRSGYALTLEDVTFEVVAYRFDGEKGRLRRNPESLWKLPRTDTTRLRSAPRLVVAEEGGAVAIFAPGSSWVNLLATRFEESGVRLVGQQTIQVGHAVSDVALSRDGCLAAVVGPQDKGAGYIRLFRSAPVQP